MAHFGQHYQSGPTGMGSAAPSPIAPYPAPPGPMAATANAHSYQSYSHPAASMPPVAMPSNGFAVPPLRHSMDSTTSSYTTLPSRSSFHSLPALPRSITPEVPKHTPSNSLPPLSIINLTNRNSVSPSYDSVHKQWLIPGESGVLPNAAIALMDLMLQSSTTQSRHAAR